MKHIIPILLTTLLFSGCASTRLTEAIESLPNMAFEEIAAKQASNLVTTSFTAIGGTVEEGALVIESLEFRHNNPITGDFEASGKGIRRSPKGQPLAATEPDPPPEPEPEAEADTEPIDE